MADMPQRPRAHVLETEARRQFRGLVDPHGWVVRDVDNPDYGVDDLVEVFDTEGNATGLQFYVQSRGTDMPLAAGLSTRVDVAHQNYFRSLPLPVLIVRYHAPTQKTYVRWFHRYDPYPREVSQTITFDSDDEIDVGSATELAREVRQVRFWESTSLVWPVGVVVQSAAHHSARDIALALHPFTRDSGVIRVRDHGAAADESAFDMLVYVSDDAIRVEASLASQTLHTNTEALDVADIANLVAFGIAAILSRFGHYQKAARLFEKALTAAHFNPENIEIAGRLLAEGDQYEAVVNIGEYWLAAASKSRHLGPSFLLLNVFTAEARGGSVQQRRRIADLLQRLGDRVCVLDGETALAGEAFVTAARICFGIGDWRTADESFRRATTLDPARTDIIKEVAGAAHNAGDYARAVELYAVAIELEPDNERLQLRRADSLMKQGRLRAAAAIFDSYFGREPVPFETIWYLKTLAVRFLVSSGLPDGERDPAAAVAALAAAPAGETPQQADARFLAAARLDPLSFEVWSAIGEFQLARGNAIRAAGPLSIAALMDRTPRSWSKSIANAIRAGLDDLADYSIGQALFEHGDELHIAMREFVSGDEDAQRIGQYLEDRDIAEGRPRKEDRRRDRDAQ